MDVAWGLATTGALLLLSLGATALGERTRLPSVTLLLLLGVDLGVFDLLPPIGGAMYPLVTDAALGLPMALLSGRLRPGEPTLVEALGTVLLAGGLALLLEVSHLLTAVTLGAVVTNLARHHTRTFRAIANLEKLLLVLFFVLSGAQVDRDALWSAGGLVLAYVALRVVGRLAGAWGGGALGRVPRAARPWLGLALLPQAGVALGMALVAVARFPDLAPTVLPVVVVATVVFEVVGPILTRVALARLGEVPPS